MATNSKFKSDAFEAIHSAVSGMYRAGTIDKETLRSFDDSCLTVPAAFKPQEIKAIRETNHVSQPVFARYLNTSESTVQKWESGAKKPSGMALKLLTVVQKHGLQVLG
jgi:putative transcriptional regulator